MCKSHMMTVNSRAQDVRAVQVCMQICLRESHANSQALLANGTKLLRAALGLWDILIKPLAPHNDCVHLTWCILISDEKNSSEII